MQKNTPCKLLRPGVGD